jgi:hypothetical protein
MTRQLFSTGSAYEPQIGCSRAVRSGNSLTISATAPRAGRKRHVRTVAGVLLSALTNGTS